MRREGVEKGQSMKAKNKKPEAPRSPTKAKKATHRKGQSRHQAAPAPRKSGPKPTSIKGAPQSGSNQAPRP